jgi:hypothetical protein|tara:strand:- start:897 stop:1313 length:417 start_codon:yes stop_codon:yes gene_type:complete
MSEVFKLDDVELMWPFLYERNKLSGKYQVDLVNLSDDQVELIEKTGVSVRQKEDKGFYITCKSKNYEITPYDKNGDIIASDIKVGNGSKATIMLKPYSWKSPTGTSGMSMGISKLVVTDLNAYTPEPVNEVSEDEETL